MDTLETLPRDLPGPLRIATRAGLYTWPAGEPAPVAHLADHEVSAMDPGDGGWAVLDGNSVWRRGGGDTAPAERSWHRAAELGELESRCLDVLGAGVLVGTTEAHLLHLDGDDLNTVEAFDAAPGRESWYTPWGGPPDVRSIAVDLALGVFVNIHVGGILRGTPDLQEWTPTIDIDADVHEVRTSSGSDGGLVWTASARGLAVSDDAGDTWAFMTEGLHARYCRAVAPDGDTCLLSASAGPSGGRAAVYRWQRGAAALVRCDAGLPAWFSGNVNTGCLALSGDHGVIAAPSGEVYLSSDRGETWRLVARDLPEPRQVALG